MSRAVNQDGARAALAFAATVFRARIIQIIAKRKEQRTVRVDGQLSPHAIDNQVHAFILDPLSETLSDGSENFYNGLMGFSVLRLCRIFVLMSLAGLLLSAQTWQTATILPGIDMSGLSTQQKATVLKILRDQPCSCGCGMKLAECRIADPKCEYSLGMAKIIIESVRQGKTVDQALQAAINSKWGPAKILDNAVKIPVAGAPLTGAADARLTIVEFSDFQCPYCAAAVPQIREILKAYPTQVKLIFKQFPLEEHPQADLAATAAVAAQKQGKFWQMHDALFAHSDALSRKSILGYAKEIGLDVDKLETDMDTTAVRETVERDVQDGNDANVQGTPTIFIDGQRYNGAITFDALKPILDSELKHLAANNRTVAAR
jgi:protein-disulfide isomerase